MIDKMFDRKKRNFGLGREESKCKRLNKVKSWQWICLLLVLGCMIHFGTGQVRAASVRYATTDGLNIRKKPTSKAKVIGTYQKGAKISCYGTSGNWTKVKYKGKYGYVYSKYLSKKKPAATYTRYVAVKVLNVRAKASTKSKIVGKLKKGAKLTCYSNKKGWTKIKYKGKSCYVSSEFISKKKPVVKTSSEKEETKQPETNTATKPDENVTTPSLGGSNTPTTDSTYEKGKAVAEYALQFVGNPYKWGGSSLTEGADCSGFTMAVYEHFGYKLPHSSIDQRECGKKVTWSKMQPGDLICYEVKDGNGHVGIYVGDNKVVHASSEKTGIKISVADYRAVNCVRRIVK